MFSQLFQLSLIWYIDPDNIMLFISLSIVLGIVVSMNFFNSIFLTILQAKGEFKKHSFTTLINVFVSTMILYPLSFLLNIFGVVLSRLIGVISLTLSYVKPLVSEKSQVKANMSVSDFNLSLILLGNFANIIILSGRFFSGISGGVDITFFTYSVVLLNAVLTAVVGNVNTLVLRIISASVYRDFRVIFISLLISISVGLSLYFIVQNYSVSIVQFIFERGAFNADDTLNTAEFLRKLSLSFVLIFVATTLFRPYFTLPKEYLRGESKKIAIPLIVILLFAFMFKYIEVFSTYNSIDFISIISIVYFVASSFSFYKYISYEY
jgi:hypothetical protein